MTIWAALKAWILWKLETEPKKCLGCEARIDENARLFRLIQQYVERDTAKVEETPVKLDEEDYKPLKTTKKAWSVKRALLEENSRKEAELLRQKKAEMTAQPSIEKVPIVTEIDLDKEISDVRGH